MGFLAPHLTQDLGFSKLQLGSLSSAFSLSYAVNKFVSGVLADAYSPALLFSFGLIANGLLYLILSFSSSFGIFTIVCALNGNSRPISTIFGLTSCNQESLKLLVLRQLV